MRCGRWLRSERRDGTHRTGAARLLVLICAVAACSGCSEEGLRGPYRLELHEGAGPCAGAEDGGLAACPELEAAAAQLDQPALPPEQIRGQVYVSRLASEHSPFGMYLYLELQRPSGELGVLEVDAPLGFMPGRERARPRVVYKEFLDGQLTFSSFSARGRLDLPPDPECLCQDGRLELLLAGAGPDGEPLTEDDELRRISRAQFSVSGSYCRNPLVLELPESLEVHLLRCPGWAGPPPEGQDDLTGEQETEVYVAVGEGCEGEPQYESVEEEEHVEDWEADESGCGGDTQYADSAEEEDPYAGEEGCVTVEDDPSDGEEVSTSEGCDSGDSSGEADSGGGCESSSSDSSSSGGDCEGDAVAATLVPASGGRAGEAESSRTTRPRHRRFDPTLRLLMVGLGLTLVRRTWRRRRT